MLTKHEEPWPCLWLPLHCREGPLDAIVGRRDQQAPVSLPKMSGIIKLRAS